MKTYSKGDTVGKRLRFYDETDAAVDPDFITITIEDPSGTIVDTLGKDDLTKEDTGVYKMLWNIPDDAAAGFWLILVKGTRVAGDVRNTELFSFQVVA